MLTFLTFAQIASSLTAIFFLRIWTGSAARQINLSAQINASHSRSWNNCNYVLATLGRAAPSAYPVLVAYEGSETNSESSCQRDTLLHRALDLRDAIDGGQGACGDMRVSELSAQLEKLRDLEARTTALVLTAKQLILKATPQAF